MCDADCESLVVELGNTRTDTYVKLRFPKVSRREIRRYIRSGLILVNERRVLPGHTLRAGDVISLRAPLEEVKPRPGLLNEDIEQNGTRVITILYEDEYLLAVEKPRAMHSVLQMPDDPLTLADCIAATRPICEGASANIREAGLVQRLDYYTSGALLAAKNRKIWDALRKALMHGDVEKHYVALVEGKPEKSRFEVSESLVQKKGGKKMLPASRVRHPRKPQTAKSGFSLVHSFENSARKHTFSIIRCRSYRTHRHQIRVHLAFAGLPLVGDSLYESSLTLKDLPPSERSDIEPLEGFYLHAERISLVHPVLNTELDIESPAILLR